MDTADCGRVEGLPQSKVVSVLAAPGSGYAKHVNDAAQKAGATVFDCSNGVRRHFQHVVLTLEHLITKTLK